MAQAATALVTNSMEDAAIDITYDNTNKVLTIVNKDKYLKFQLVGSVLYYDEGTYASTVTDDDAKKTAAASATVGTGTENILCDYVSTFSVDTTTKETGIVVLRLNVEFKGRSKAVIQNVYLRNFHPTH